MKSTLTSARSAVGRVFFQRCVYLFFTLILLISVAPLIELFQAILIARLVGIYRPPEPVVNARMQECS